MKEYIITRDYSGYVRGYTTYSVLANSEEEALSSWYSGTVVDDYIVRNDTETTDVQVTSSKEITNENDKNS